MVSPAQVGADLLAVVAIVDAVEAPDLPAFVSGEELVAGGKNVVGDEQLAQVLATLAAGEGVDAFMAQRHFTGGDSDKSSLNVVGAEPDQPGPRVAHGDESLHQRGEARVDGPGAAIEDNAEAAS